LINTGYCQCGCGQRTKTAGRNYLGRGIRRGEPFPFLVGHNRLSVRGPARGAGMKWCGNCNSVKSVTEFWKAAHQIGGLQGRCKLCSRAHTASYREENRQETNRHAANSHRRKRLGMRPEDYDALLTKQGGLCAICRRPEHYFHKDGVPRALAVDHHHGSGVIRGLLCGDCNRGLGFFGDSAERLRGAAAFIDL
jgi:hypothetical protein